MSEQTSVKVAVHCPSCGEAIDIAIQVAGVQRGAEHVSVDFDTSTARHLCRNRPYVDPQGRPAPRPAPAPRVNGL